MKKLYIVFTISLIFLASCTENKQIPDNNYDINVWENKVEITNSGVSVNSSWNSVSVNVWSWDLVDSETQQTLDEIDKIISEIE